MDSNAVRVGVGAGIMVGTYTLYECILPCAYLRSRLSGGGFRVTAGVVACHVLVDLTQARAKYSVSRGERFAIRVETYSTTRT